MDQKELIRQKLRQAKMVKDQLSIKSSRLENYLHYQKEQIETDKQLISSIRKCCSKPVYAEKAFRWGFARLSQVEKADFYLMNMELIREIYCQVQGQKNQRRDQSGVQKGENGSYESSQIKILVKLEKDQKRWMESSLELFSKQNIIKIAQYRFQLDMQRCLIRKSRNNKESSIVLIQLDEQKQIRIMQSPVETASLYTLLNRAWRKGQSKKLRQMINGSRKVDEHSALESKNQKNQSFTKNMKVLEELAQDKAQEPLIANDKSNNSIIAMKESEKVFPIEDYLNDLQSLQNYEEKNIEVYYHKNGNRVKKRFKFNKETPSSLIPSIIKSPYHIRKRIQTTESIKIIKSFPSQDSSIYHQIDKTKGQKIQFLFSRQCLTRNNQTLFVDRSIKHSQIGLPQVSSCNQGWIEFCIWRIKQNRSYIELLVEAEITYEKDKGDGQKITSRFIGQFDDYVNNKCFTDHILDISGFDTEDFQNDYLSVLSNSENDDDEEYVTVTGSIKSTSEKKATAPLKKQRSVFLDDITVSQRQILEQMVSTNLLKHKFPMVPLAKGQPQYFRPTRGFSVISEDWVFDKEGYLLNENIEKIKMQSSVLKLVFQRIGKNLLAGKSILNMSLPVQVFGAQSNLEIIAKRCQFLPRIIQKAANEDNPVQRIKIVSCVLISNIISLIRMQKPFNPILGQTYQGIVDGCLVYGQQISHHPPISSIYMVGRGYKMYGNFEAKVNLGLNSANGNNQGLNNIVFDKYPGSIKFEGTHAKLYGLVYGSRKVQVTEKSCIFDEQNRLFAEIKWGKSKTGRAGMKEYHDYFSGKLVKLKEGTDMSKYQKIKSSNIEMQYGELYGRLQIGLFFEDQQLFRSETDMPHQIYEYEPCLESDFRKREDLVMRKMNDYNRAQEQKERLQQIQRRDRKLREQAHKHK